MKSRILGYVMVWLVTSSMAFAVSGPYVGLMGEYHYLYAKYVSHAADVGERSGSHDGRHVQPLIGFSSDLWGGLTLAIELQPEWYHKKIMIEDSGTDYVDLDKKYCLLGMLGFAPDVKDLFFVSMGVGFNRLHTNVNAIAAQAHPSDLQAGVHYERLLSQSLGVRATYSGNYLRIKQAAAAGYKKLRTLDNAFSLGLIYHI